MKSVRTRGNLRRMLAVLLLLVFVFSQSAMADSTANQAIMDARSGVLFIQLGHVKDKEFYPVAVGSAFIINENTLLTCYHVCHVQNSEMRKAMKKEFGKDWEKHMGLRVALANGTYVGATENLANSEVDFSILTVDRSISGHKFLPLRSEEAKTSEAITALGFPYNVSELREGTATKYTANDVSATSGTVSNSESPINGINFIQHNAMIAGGSSGGPLVDNDGHVIGINKGTDLRTDKFCYATDITQVMLSLDQLNIEYTLADSANVTTTGSIGDGGSVSQEVPDEPEVNTTELEGLVSEAAGKTESDYTAKSWAPFQIALDGANDAMNATSQTEVDGAARALKSAMDDLEEKAKPNYILIGGGIAAAVVVIGLIAALVLTKKKAPVQHDTSAPYNQPTERESSFAEVKPTRDNTQPNVQGRVDFESTSVLDAGGGETDALFGASFEETVLIGKPYAILKRKSTQEEVTASADNFIIGKDRRKADYCVEGNKSISRSHAKLMNDNGRVYIVDLGSTNGTYVNGVKCGPNHAVPVNTGDRITMANEEFEIRLL